MLFSVKILSKSFSLSNECIRKEAKGEISKDEYEQWRGSVKLKKNCQTGLFWFVLSGFLSALKKLLIFVAKFIIVSIYQKKIYFL